jgi:hypothetical protein
MWTAVLLPKPAIGDPCNACGLCCRLQVCSAGSYTLGLVETYGDRAPGPCPALVAQPDGREICGMMLRPKDYAIGRGAAHDLRAAIGIMIGSGAGCDEAGDERDETAQPKIERVTAAYVERVGAAKIRSAVATWFGIKP